MCSWEHLQKVGRKSPGLDNLKEWITQQPDGTTLHSDDLIKVAKENKVTIQTVKRVIKDFNNDVNSDKYKHKGRTTGHHSFNSKD